MTTEDAQEILTVARELFAQSPDMMSFFHEIFGIEGAMRTQLKTPEERLAFQHMPEYDELLEMMKTLRKMQEREQEKEPTSNLGVRIPVSLHNKLLEGKHNHYTSLNKLAIALLRKPVPVDIVEQYEPNKDEDDQPITVRLPASLHMHLRMEASDHRISLTALAIIKLQQTLDPTLLDEDT